MSCEPPAPIENTAGARQLHCLFATLNIDELLDVAVARSLNAIVADIARVKG
jgi:hypothetical protein